MSVLMCSRGLVSILPCFDRHDLTPEKAFVCVHLFVDFLEEFNFFFQCLSPVLSVQMGQCFVVQVLKNKINVVFSPFLALKQ